MLISKPVNRCSLLWEGFVQNRVARMYGSQCNRIISISACEISAVENPLHVAARTRVLGSVSQRLRSGSGGIVILFKAQRNAY
jgi:hypothetical protein